MPYVRFPLSLRNVEDLLHERGIDVSYETVRFRWNRFGPMFASVHASISYHFNHERRLSLRDHFNANRTATFAEWRLLCSA